MARFLLMCNGNVTLIGIDPDVALEQSEQHSVGSPAEEMQCYWRVRN